MNMAYYLIQLDHLFTEKIYHWLEQLRFGKEIDFSIPGGGY